MKMSITRALAELKSLDDRIHRAIQAGGFIQVAKGKDDKRTLLRGANSVAEVERTVQGNLDHVERLIRNRREIKSKIILANVTNRVTLAGEEMSVAEAIEMKNQLPTYSGLLHRYQEEYTEANRLVDATNQKLLETIEAAVSAAFGNSDRKIDQSTYDTIANSRKSVGEASLIDPGKLLNRINNLQKKVDDLSTEINFVLSEVNSRTEIEVDM